MVIHTGFNPFSRMIKIPFFELYNIYNFQFYLDSIQQAEMGAAMDALEKCEWRCGIFHKKTGNGFRRTIFTRYGNKVFVTVLFFVFWSSYYNAKGYESYTFFPSCLLQITSLKWLIRNASSKESTDKNWRRWEESESNRREIVMKGRKAESEGKGRMLHEVSHTTNSKLRKARICLFSFLYTSL